MTLRMVSCKGDGRTIRTRIRTWLLERPVTDILSALKASEVLNVTEHSSRASVRGISAPFVHIFVCVRSIIVKVLCLNATLPPYDQVSYKETNEYAARIRLSILQVYYLFLNYLNIAIKNLYLRQFIPSLKAGVFLHPDHNFIE
jgi:hypothetical protein